MRKKLWIKILLGVATVLLGAVVVFVGYLTVTEYRPAQCQQADVLALREDAVPQEKDLTIYTWNIGYAGLGEDSDFFMDGGSMVNPPDGAVEKNLSAIQEFISENEADAWLLQEIDICSNRTEYTNELTAISEVYAGSYALAYNYKCAFVPYPLPPIGKIESGIATFTSGKVTAEPERIALPCPFSWPVSTANLKRCLLVTRLAVADSDKELVLVNLHLEAYDDGSGKIAQTKQLMEFLQQEYEKGNYVIAGGDFNQSFPAALDTYPILANSWLPGLMEESALPEGFSYAYDLSTATCRLLDRAYDANSQLYVLDGFIVSPNVQVEKVETVDLSFRNSDHNPVKLQVTLLAE